MQKFQLKFIDIMIGVVLGLGFQWWPELTEPWQYLAFAFAYLNIIDYWIDYNPIAKKYSVKLEVDVILHILIIFGMFLLISSTLQTLTYFFLAFAFYRAADIVWIWRIKREHRIPASDLVFINTWYKWDFVEAILAGGFYFLAADEILNPTILLLIFICIRILTRTIESKSYKKVFYAI